MKLAVHVALLTSVFLYLMAEAEYGSFNWTEVLPYVNILCHGIDDSVLITSNGTANKEDQAVNPCCKSFDHGTECTDDTIEETYPGMTECMHFQDENSRDVLEYKFIVAEPKGGCQSTGTFAGVHPSCGQTVSAAPWGNLYPVFSYDYRVNFKNKHCALCHGAENITEWFAYGMFKGNDLYRLNKFDNFNWSNVVVKFLPPAKESVQNENVCYTVINNCSASIKESFYIPSALNMTRKQIINACEDGRISLYYFSKNEKFKNVFCALCNDFVDRVEDTVRCESGLGIRDFIDIGSARPSVKDFNRPFAFLIDHGRAFHKTGIKASRDFPKKHIACLREETEDNTKGGNTCRDVLCPTLQTRLSNGTCAFTMDDMFFTKIFLSLYLSCNQHIDEEIFENMSKSEVVTKFKRFMPWPQKWEIIFVLMLNDASNNKTEFVATVGTMFFEFLPVALLKDLIGDTLGKEWVIDFEKNVTFLQKFHNHGVFDQMSLSDKSNEFIQQRWRLKNDNDPLSNLSNPVWKTLFSNTASFFPDPPSDNMEITKLFFCDQIELKANEFIAISDSLPVYLKRQGRYLHPSQYHMYIGDDDKQAILICLEDSRFSLGNENKGGISPGLGPCRILCLMEWVLFMVYT